MSDKQNNQKLTREEIKKQINKQCEFAQYLQDIVIQQWTEQIFNGKYNDYQKPPKKLETEDDNINIEIYGEETNVDECEYGDIIMVKNIPFVAPTGMLIPKDLLMTKILPLIDSEMKKLKINQEDIEEALEQCYEYE